MFNSVKRKMWNCFSVSLNCFASPQCLLFSSWYWWCFFFPLVYRHLTILVEIIVYNLTSKILCLFSNHSFLVGICCGPICWVGWFSCCWILRGLSVLCIFEYNFFVRCVLWKRLTSNLKPFFFLIIVFHTEKTYL